jgi:hypothetical protein
MKKMKILKLSLMACLTFNLAILTSCSKDGEECHECHIALENADGSETMWEIENPSGGDEFCGDELTNVEASDYLHTVSEMIISTDGTDTLQPGNYGVSNGYEIHCEEHGDH